MPPPYYYLVIHAKNYVLSCFLINTKPIFNLYSCINTFMHEKDIGYRSKGVLYPFGYKNTDRP